MTPPPVKTLSEMRRNVMGKALRACQEDDATVNDLGRADLGLVTLHTHSELFGTAGPRNDVWTHIDEGGRTLAGSFSYPGRAVALPLIPLTAGGLAAVLFAYLGWVQGMMLSAMIGATAATIAHLEWRRCAASVKWRTQVLTIALADTPGDTAGPESEATTRHGPRVLGPQHAAPSGRPQEQPGASPESTGVHSRVDDSGELSQDEIRAALYGDPSGDRAAMWGSGVVDFLTNPVGSVLALIVLLVAGIFRGGSRTGTPGHARARHGPRP